MYILLSLTAFTVLVSLLIGQTNTDPKNKKTYLIIAGIAIAVVMGLRALQGVGSHDTKIYALAFEGMHNVGSFLTYAKRNLLENGFLFSESGFFFYMWLVSRVTANAQIFVLLTSAFMIFCVCRFIYKNSEDVVFSLLAFLTLGSFTFLMNGMRQAIAMCICLLAYEYVKERKLIRFLLIVFIAMLFHKTAIVFLIVYFFPCFKTWKSMLIFVLTSVVFVRILPNYISLYDSLTGEDYAGAESFDSGGVVAVLVYIAALVIALLVISKIKSQHDKNCVCGVIIGLFIYLLRYTSVQIMERISYYFFFFIIILFANALQKFNVRDRRIMRIVVGVAAVVLFAYRLRSGAFANFHFFFQ